MGADNAIHHPAESELFDDTLSCELDIPAEFVAGSRQTARSGSAEALLRGLAQVEEARSDDTHEDRGNLPPLVQRMDAKLDLLLVLLGRLARQQGDDLPLRPVRWSRKGLRLETGARAGAVPGSAGSVKLQPADWLPDHVELPVTVIAESASGTGSHYLWLRFEPLGAGLEAAMERHIFRLHRRQVAETRRIR